MDTLAFVQNLSLWQILLLSLIGLMAFGGPVLVVFLVVGFAVRAGKQKQRGNTEPSRESAATAKD